MSDNTRVVAALATHDAQQVIGTAESRTLEFKREQYRLDTIRGKWELSKDVAAMANAAGGLIIIGIGTSKDPMSSQDVASELRPVNIALLDPERVKGVLRDWLFPPQVPQLQVFPSAVGSSTGYLVITIDPAPESDRYVLTTKTESEDGQLKGAVGVPIRSGDEVRWLTPIEIYRLMNDGYSSRQSGIPSSTASPSEQPPSASATARADQALAELERLQGWEDQPVLYWQSYVEPAPVALSGLFHPDGVRGFLDHPNALRPQGFHFHNPYVPVQAIASGLFHPSSNGVALTVGLDGTVTAGVIADRSLLARGQGSGLEINPGVLTEFTYEYFRLADEQVRPLADGTWTHRLLARGLLSAGVTLSAGRSGASYISNPQPALDDSRDRSWQANGAPGADSGFALSVFYGIFGLDAAANPWWSGGRVDIDAFLRDVGGSAAPARDRALGAAQPGGRDLHDRKT